MPHSRSPHAWVHVEQCSGYFDLLLLQKWTTPRMLLIEFFRNDGCWRISSNGCGSSMDFMTKPFVKHFVPLIERSRPIAVIAPHVAIFRCCGERQVCERPFFTVRVKMTAMHHSHNNTKHHNHTQEIATLTIQIETGARTKAYVCTKLHAALTYAFHTSHAGLMSMMLHGTTYQLRSRTHQQPCTHEQQTQCCAKCLVCDSRLDQC